MENNLEHFICTENCSIVDALKTINTNAKGVVFVVDNFETKILKGILTDGDARRLLIEGHELGSKIAGLYNTNYTKSYTDESDEERIKKLTNRVKVIPIVDSTERLVNFFHKDSLTFVPVAVPSLKGNEFKYLVDAFLSTWISSTGSYIQEFESGFSEFCEVKNSVAVSNGTVAIHLALEVLGVGRGDEVIIPDLTFAATINTVLHAGATPVIVDVDEDSWCIDPEEIRKAITPKTKAIIPVHLYGQSCDMDAIMSIAKEHNLFVVEDCAEAHGARFNGKRVGSIGDIGCFSFFANKVMTTGEGGMCTTNDDELARKMKVMRDHGMNKSKKYYHEVVGYNYRMTNLQAAIGVAQLERIENTLKTRSSIEKYYDESLGDFDFLETQKKDLSKREKITWLVSMLVNNGRRDELIDILKENGIDVRPFFVSLSDMDIYKKYSFSSKVSKELSQKGINFPTSSDLKFDTIDKIKSILENKF